MFDIWKMKMKIEIQIEMEKEKGGAGGRNSPRKHYLKLRPFIHLAGYGYLAAQQFGLRFHKV
jgi:hypothetical protein